MCGSWRTHPYLAVYITNAIILIIWMNLTAWLVEQTFQSIFFGKRSRAQCSSLNHSLSMLQLEVQIFQKQRVFSGQYYLLDFHIVLAFGCDSLRLKGILLSEANLCASLPKDRKIKIFLKGSWKQPHCSAHTHLRKTRTDLNSSMMLQK